MNIKTVLFAASALVLIWTAVGAIMKATEKHTSTPEKVLAGMDSAPWMNGKEVSEAERRAHLDRIISETNKLDFDQRRRMREDSDSDRRKFFESLTKEERTHFVQSTVEQHFKSVMKAFNAMAREERQKIVNQALKDMQRQQPDSREMDRLREEDSKVFEGVVEKGLGAYYQDASAETKLDLAPLMEQMQQRIRGFGHR